MAIKPLYKCVGGKRRLAPEILKLIPTTPIEAYYDPFFGGGAIFCALWNEGRLKDTPMIVLNDLDRWITEILSEVKDGPESLHSRLVLMKEAYDRDPEKTYSLIRDYWNKRHFSASKALFLRKTSFNGLWRESKAGKMNAPWGKGEKFEPPAIELLLEWQQALRNAGIHSGSYEECLPPDDMKKGTVLYFDPPYITTWNDYKAVGWTKKDFEKLLIVCREWDKSGAHVVLSHCDAPEVREYLKQCWPDGTIHETTRRNMVNSDGEGRQPIPELIVTSPTR